MAEHTSTSEAIPRIFPQHFSETQRVNARRTALLRIVNFPADSIPVDGRVLEAAFGRNIENAIGVVSVPVGIAGPLVMRGDWASGTFFLPLATTEGALVASVNRGCKAIAKSGGAMVLVKDFGITRGPVFRVSGLSQAREFVDWLDQHRKDLREVAERTSRHLRLLDHETRIVGRSVFVRFRFDTQEAMGMNMATIATQTIAEFVAAKLDVHCVSVTGNFCVDKKPAFLNSLLGRGKQVWAEVVLSRTVVRDVLKSSVEELIEVFYRKTLIGSAISGSMGFNGQFANVVAAIFLATGQDMAHVVHGSVGIATAERDNGGVHVSVFLPSLILGTVGGGTHLPCQHAALEILGLGKGRRGEAKAFAEIVGGAVLAGEISLLSSLAEGSLAQAHERLGRSGERSKKSFDRFGTLTASKLKVNKK